MSTSTNTDSHSTDEGLLRLENIDYLRDNDVPSEVSQGLRQIFTFFGKGTLTALEFTAGALGLKSGRSKSGNKLYKELLRQGYALLAGE